MEQHLHPTQQGFIREGECMTHVYQAVQEIERIKNTEDATMEAGFLFLDFK